MCADVEGECATALPGQIQDLRGQDRPRRDELAHAEDVGDAMPGRITLTFEATEIGGGDGERAVVEELAHGLDRLADVTAELGGGVAEDMDAGRRQTGLREIAPEAVVEGSAGDALGDLRPPARATRRAAWRLRSLPTSPRDRRIAESAGAGSSRRPRRPPLPR